MKELIIVLGIRRSGNHAIVNWLKNQIKAKQTVKVLNNKTPLSCLEVDQSLKKKEVIIITYESVPINIFKNGNIIKNEHEFGNRKKTNIMILRDPFNLFASVLKGYYWKEAAEDYIGFIELWKGYAKEHLQETQHIKSKSIIYNKWFENKNYRENICKDLKFPFSDACLNYVGNYAGGSSFDRRRFKRNAQDMNVLNRWQKMLSNKKYIKMFRDKELLTLARRIFPEMTNAESSIIENLQ
tara:strand:- start:2608 stop:3327 length:720 start_codon:yes stop_codon:yes gene_type:complete